MKKYLSKKYIIIYIAIIVLSVGGYYANEANNRLDIELYSVEKGAVEELLEEDGRIEAVNTSEIQAKVTGVIEELPVSVGDYVEKGYEMIYFDDDVLALEMDKLASEIKRLDAELLEVSKPADQERINQAAAQVSQARLDRNQKKTDYENNLTLYNAGTISKNTLDISKNLYDMSVQAYNVAVNDLSLVKKGVSDNLTSQYKASMESLDTQKVILEKQLSDYVVKAPMAGTVLISHVKVGHYVMAGQPLFEVADLSELKLVTDILEDDYNNISMETSVRLHDKNADIYYDAIIKKIHPVSETSVSDLGIKQNRVTIEIEPQESLIGYIVGQELDVVFTINKSDDTLRIPTDSVYKSKGEYFVFASENKTLVKKKIEVGIEGEDYFQVISGIDEGAEIVKVITNDLTEGQKLK